MILLCHCCPDLLCVFFAKSKVRFSETTWCNFSGSNVSITDNNDGTVTIGSSSSGLSGNVSIAPNLSFILPQFSGFFRVTNYEQTPVMTVTDSTITLSSSVVNAVNGTLLLDAGGALNYRLGGASSPHFRLESSELWMRFNGSNFFRLSNGAALMSANQMSFQAGADSLLIISTQADAVNITLDASHYLNIAGLPISNPGGSGRVWKNGNVLNIT